MILTDYLKLLSRVQFAERFIDVSLNFSTHPVACDYHKRGLQALRAVSKTIHNVIDAQNANNSAESDADREACADKLMEATLAFDIAPFWIMPVHLGDYLVIDNATDEFKIEPYGSWLPIRDNMPIVTRIPLPELDRLYDILETLYDETGIDITAQDIQFMPIGSDR